MTGTENGEAREQGTGTVARVWLLGLIIQIIIVGLAADCAPGDGGGTATSTATPTATQGTDVPTTTTTPGTAVPTTTTTPAPEDGQVIVTQGSNTAVVTVEFASTPAQRQTGLMFREHMDEDAGMLFLFPNDSSGGFWMRNTYIPLDIAYIGADGTVQDIRQGEPLNETPLFPGKPYRYVLEVNQGWFERHGMGVGAKVTLPENLPEAE